MHRRSERLTKTYTDRHASNTYLDSDDDETPTPARKIRKERSSGFGGKTSNSKKARRRHGKLEQIGEMPFDILFEIFAHLTPLDLLNLSRTSKPLRNVLMQRSARYVWKNARSRIVGLPECPDDMSEPQYANLVFYPYCQFCLKGPVHSQAILWAARTRSCKKCIPENFVPFSHDCAIPHSIVPRINISTSSRWVTWGYCLRTLRRYQTELDSLEKGCAFDQWCASKCLESQARNEHATKCEEWNRNRSEERSNELENIRQRRYEAIKERLSDIGWGEEIVKLEAKVFWSDQLFNHKLVRQPRDLTDRIWGHIKAPLIDFMEATKEKRIVRERAAAISKRGQVLSDILDNYASSQDVYTILPPLADVAILPAFRTIIEDTPMEKGVTEDNFREAMTVFPQIVKMWRKSQDTKLLEMLKANPEITVDISESSLQLATIFFHCSSCTEDISYPRVLVHKCTSYVSPFNEDADPYFRNLKCLPWNTDSILEFDPDVYRRARLILQDCGFDPDTTTRRALSDDTRFECCWCSNSVEGRLLMKWPVVVRHIAHHCRTDKGGMNVVQLPTLTKNEALLTELLEYAQLSPISRHWSHDNCWICIECKRKMPWDKSFEHLQEQHPDIIPSDYDELEHVNHFDQYLTLHLDTSTESPLFDPIRVNTVDPAFSFRAALSFYEHLSSHSNLDTVCEQMAQAFLTGPAAIP